MNIYTYGHKVLTEKSEEVKKEEFNEELKATLDEMVRTMREASGCGLAANQVGITKRFFVLEVDDEVKKVINPEILEFSKETCVREEGCLSIPGIYKNVTRPEKIKVRYFDEEGVEHKEELDGFIARAFQHEFDHIDGVLFVEKLEPVAKSLIRKKLMQMKKEGKIREF